MVIPRLNRSQSLLVLLIAELASCRPGGSTLPPSPLHDFSVSGPAHLVGRTTWSLEKGRPHPTLTVLNPGQDTLRVGFGYCSFELRAYRTATRRDPPVWRHPSPASCPDVGVEARIPPGDSREIDVQERLAGQKPARLPRGLLHFGIVIRPERPERIQVIPAGELRIRGVWRRVPAEQPKADAPPLQTERSVYSAGVGTRSAGVTIRFRFTNRTGQTVYAAGCRGVDPPVLEKQLDGRWVSVHAPFVDLCEPTVRPIRPDEVYRSSLRVRPGQPGSRVAPTVPPLGIPGTYRLVWNVYGRWRAGHAPSREDLLPLEQRISNPFGIEP